MSIDINLLVNVCSIGIFAGVVKATQDAHTKQIDALQASFNEKIDALKETWRDRQEDFKEFIDGKFIEVVKKQDKHNGLIERTFRLEEHQAVQDEQIKVANHRIQDLELKK